MKTVPEKAGKDVLHKVKKTPLAYCLKPIINIKSHNTEPGPNSDYRGPPIDLKNIKAWDDFMADGEITSMLKDRDVNLIFNQEFTEEELEHFQWSSPPVTKRLSEQAFERHWSSVTNALNVILEKMAAQYSGTENPICVKIGDGTCATRKAPARKVATKANKADFAGYQHFPDGSEYSTVPPEEIDNRI